MEKLKTPMEQDNAELQRERSAVVISGDDPYAKYDMRTFEYQYPDLCLGTLWSTISREG
jgi:hypothetical protein